MSKERAKLDRDRPFSEITGPGEFYRFSQDGKTFGGDELEIFPSEVLDMAQNAVPSAAKQALDTAKSFIARTKEEADRWRDRATVAETKVAQLQGQLDAGAGADVAALQQQIDDMKTTVQAALDKQGEMQKTIDDQHAALEADKESIANAQAAVDAAAAEKADMQRELNESSASLQEANKALAELQSLESPPATPDTPPA